MIAQSGGDSKLSFVYLSQKNVFFALLFAVFTRENRPLTDTKGHGVPSGPPCPGGMLCAALPAARYQGSSTPSDSGSRPSLWV